MVNSRPVMEQFNELLRILGQYTQHGLKMDESHKCFRRVDRRKEWLRAQESEKGKGKKVVGPSVNMTEEGGKNKNNKQNKGKKRSFKENNGSFGSNKKPKLECWKCGKTGHFKRDCRSGNKKNNASASGSGKGSKDQSQDQGQNLVHVWNRFVKYSVSLSSESFYVQVDAIAWWIDSGATTHVCKDRCWFKTYEPVEDESVLYMGDDHFPPVHEKGSMVLEFSYGISITLFNMLYVPKLRKNLIYVHVSNKCGHKQVYESDKYILSKSGVFIRLGYYNNGMFMLNLNKVLDDSGSVYMSSSTVVNFLLWHVRLGHVHYKMMLEMSKDDLIPAINENPEKCTTLICAIFMQHHLKGIKRIIHETTSSYTPQQNGVVERKNKALKEMAKRKTLGEKGIDFIFVGYAEHSKTYRDDHSNDVPSETPEPRRGKRARKAKSYGSDFQLYLVEGSRDQIGSQYSYCYNIEEDHRTYNEAMQSRDAAFFSGKKQLMMRLMNDDGTIDMFKARLVIQGLRQKEGINYFDTYALVARITTIRLLFALAAFHNLVIHQMDVKTTFLNGDLEEEVYMKQSEGFVMPSKPVDQLEYSRAIGCLMYAMTSTRPDIAYVVGRLSRFTSNPSRQHWHAITRVFKYLKGTMNYGLSYVGYPSVLEAYSDASWINQVEDSSSTSGWVFLLGGCAISWASKKQTCITGSTMESNFVALAATGKEAECLRNLIHEIPIWPKLIASL
ncbi:zinc finger, CCHC-type containing protein [Tanacetum coccineum]